ncbi:unnamed protein product [Tuwongella immobilis]|uniref:Uncharacterized protein n=1 Tax=Tuwongella immobilis TaxID=692036 RepID=A0A6C2YI07_9BACT|nr:unnamed protein product [Tuwongella immobilis]VTR96964.1 unnamed protein product [Tuwongella immobilis]
MIFSCCWIKCQFTIVKWKLVSCYRIDSVANRLIEPEAVPFRTTHNTCALATGNDLGLAPAKSNLVSKHVCRITFLEELRRLRCVGEMLLQVLVVVAQAGASRQPLRCGWGNGRRFSRRGIIVDHPGFPETFQVPITFQVAASQRSRCKVRHQQRCSRAKIIEQLDKTTAVRLTSDFPNESCSTSCKSRRHQAPTTFPICAPGRPDGLDRDRVAARTEGIHKGRLRSVSRRICRTSRIFNPLSSAAQGIGLVPVRIFTKTSSGIDRPA